MNTTYQQQNKHYQQLNQHYIQLIQQAENVQSRKDAINIIHQADKVRMEMNNLTHSH